MKAQGWLLVTLVLLSACASGIHGGLTPEQVRQDIDRLGARGVIEELQASQSWEASLQEIESGTSDWLAIAGSLRAGADASAAVDLDFSVARALTTNAPGVLQLLSGPFEVTDICTVPYIEAEDDVVLKHLEDVDRALNEVRRENLMESKQHCADQMAKIKEKLSS